MQVLFVENQDSFSWNVIDCLPFNLNQIQLADAYNAGKILSQPSDHKIIIIGPGPTDPIRAGLIDIVKIAQTRRLILLGICLGFQAIAVAFGAKLVKIYPAHGKIGRIKFRASRFFQLAKPVQLVMRYHSLSVGGIIPPLNCVAESIDGNIPMAIEHESLPIAGLQFHPDSYATPNGKQMIKKFFNVALG